MIYISGVYNGLSLKVKNKLQGLFIWIKHIVNVSWIMFRQIYRFIIIIVKKNKDEIDQ